jgi:putative ABC transport system permease protein
LRLMLAGLVVGTALSLAVTRFLKRKLYAVGSTDALTFASVAVLLSVVTLIACHIPARRATSIEPTVALRGE